MCTHCTNDITLSRELAAAVYCMWLSLWITTGRLLDAGIMLGRDYFPWMSLNCKHCSYISYEYTHYEPHSVWPEGGMCCVACQTLWYFLQHSDHISGVLWRAESQSVVLGLGRWQWHTEAVNFWHAAVTNCEEKVRLICFRVIL